ncbi:Metallophosphoesterase domain-containing protein 1 [Psilocybe cubensis]|uniref:Metallophosphoesterase domain-containing protein 1 n=1 Tax=Psilocybe cubensis TaxID=181762 RepID=A0ACB8GFQ5_PSICU|nr:Metallophosphoesterase domain-containing protein 1 [Psilocybe cubensis]KAH9474535.1 Metallophosphoesterase domain-containing protein 1 [Psilocybe cubensis]
MAPVNQETAIEALDYGSSVTFKSPTEIVYLDYFPSQLRAKPPRTAEEKADWTRFVCISDTHARTFDVPDGDVLLHSGDLTNLGTEADFQKTAEWLYCLPHKTKIRKPRPNVTRRLNRDKIMDMLKGKKARDAGLVYLEDEYYEFKIRDSGRVWSVYGSPWSPWFHNGAFNYEREHAKELVAKFPKTDILLTHGPVHQIFDQVIGGEQVGCEALRARMPELRPRLHLAGHIHEAHGAYIHTWDPENNYEAPTIQNDDPRVLSDLTTSDNLPDVKHSNPERERTVFINAANWPMGNRAKRNITGTLNRKIPFGGPGFQAVVVDLKD